MIAGPLKATVEIPLFYSIIEEGTSNSIRTSSVELDYTVLV